MKRDPPTGVKCLPWESFGSDWVMTYLTTENKQQLCYRRGHDGVGDGSPACYPPWVLQVYSHWGQSSHASSPSGDILRANLYRTITRPCWRETQALLFFSPEVFVQTLKKGSCEWMMNPHRFPLKNLLKKSSEQYTLPLFPSKRTRFFFFLIPWWNILLRYFKSDGCQSVTLYILGFPCSVQWIQLLFIQE